MMKKILYIMFAVLLFSSCNKWFDVEPKGTAGGDDIFKSEVAYRDYLNGIYQTIASESLYGSNLTLGGVEFLGQTMVPVDSKLADWSSLNFNGEVGQKIAKESCQGLYYAIFQCNDMMELLERNPDVIFVEGSDKMMYAEARALRAMLHFELLRLFSPAYIADKQAKKVEWLSSTTKSEKITTELLTKKIIAELTLSIEQLKIYDPIVTGKHYDRDALVGTKANVRRWKFNYYAALAVKARALMTMGTTEAYSEALTALNTIIDSKKYTFATTILGTDMEFSTEFIFGLPSPKTGLCALSESMFAKNDVAISTSNVIYNTMSSDDRRRKWYDDTSHTTIRPKFSPNSLIYNWLTTPAIPVVKFGEIYLMAAECASVALSTGKGVEYINKFFAFRNSTSRILPDDASAAALQEALKDEYIYEFIGEGVRFYYHKRLNIGLNNFSGVGTYDDIATRYLPVIE